MANRFTGDPHSDVLILQPVVRRIAREHKVGRLEAQAWLEDALRFLELAAAAEHPISPETDADAAWHEFILFTRDYEQYCQERFGRFIHHEPYEHERPRRRFWDRLRGDGTGCGVGVGGGNGGDGGDGGGCGGGGCGGGGS